MRQGVEAGRPVVTVERNLAQPVHHVLVEQILVDLNFLMMGKSKKHWFFTDPQIIRNLQTNTEFAIVDIEFGKMLKRKGHSVYVRPAIGVGTDRPTDGGIELGYKMVGFGS